MQLLKNLIEKEGLASHNLYINATVGMEKAFSKQAETVGEIDFYEPVITSIRLVGDNVDFSIDDGEVFHEVAHELLTNSDRSFRQKVAPKGKEVTLPTGSMSIHCSRAIEKSFAYRELQDAMFDFESPNQETRFNDARWKVFTLTDEFTREPCTRETFDWLSVEKERYKDDSSFREFYSHWARSRKSNIEGDKLSPRATDLVISTLSLAREAGRDTDAVKEQLASFMHIHPIHRSLLNATIDEMVADRNNGMTA